MIRKGNLPENAAEFRRLAEEKTRQNTARVPEDVSALSTDEIRQILHELHVHQVDLETQNDELRRTLIELEASRTHYFNFYDTASVGYVTLSDNGLILECNLTTANLLGLDRSCLIRQPISSFICKDDHDVYYQHIKQLVETGADQNTDLRMVNKNGRVFWTRLTASAARDTGDAILTRIVLSDIGDQKFREKGRELTTHFTALISMPGDIRKPMSDLVLALKDWSGCNAVGIRLRDGVDYPYYEARGFPPEFVEAENRLCAYDPDGNILRDASGDPVLECMCGNILSSRIDPTKPFFTSHGSFWSNNTTLLLASTSEADRQSRTRNRCNGTGYESVALIPLRADGQVFGLIQFNNHRPDHFTPGMIVHFESLADGLATSLTRRHALKALHESENLYRSLFDNMMNGFAYCRMLFRDGKPMDFIYLDVNSAFESLTGLKDVVGRRVTAVIPGIRERDPKLFEIYGKVAMTGQPEQFEMFVEALQMWFWISVYCPAHEHFVAVFDVITERKQFEEKLEIASNEANQKKRQLEAVMEALPVGMAIVDELGGTIRSNLIYEKLWGSPLPSTKNVKDYEAYKAWWLDTGKPVRPEEWASAQAVMKGETVLGQMIEIESFDGVRKIILNSAAPVHDADGRITGSAVAIQDITNIKRIEREVIARSSELEAVFSAQNDAVLIYDTGMNVRKVNQVFFSTYGFDPVGLHVTEIIQRLSCRLLNGRPLVLEEQPTPRALRGVKNTGSFFVITLPDGSDRFIETSSGPMRQGDRITGTVTVWHDITEFKQAEKKLMESQEQLILAADAGQVGMFYLNMESDDLQWTQRHEVIFGYAPTPRNTTTKRTYQDWSDRVHPADLPQVEADMRDAMEKKIPCNIEYRIVWPDESLHWVNVISKYFFDKSGLCTRLMGAVMDITKRKQSEERLRELSQRLSYHVDNSPLAVIEWGPDMRLTRWSHMAERIFGWSAEEVIGKRMEDFRWIYVEDAKQVEDVSIDLQTGNNPCRFSINRNYRKDGTVIHCEWYNSSLMDKFGELRSILSLALDVTERQKAEESLKESLHEKEVLLKEIHHRVKNNMQVISSLVNLQADTIDDPVVQDHLLEIRDRVRSMALVHEMLYQTENFSIVPFDEYVRGILHYLKNSYGGSKTAIRFNMDLQPVFLSIEKAVPCGLILNELITNTIKHAFAKRIQGEVRTMLHQNPDATVCLQISDDGIGLPPEPDWRKSKTLGLRLVDMLAGQLKATVEVTREKGTEFRICFKPL